MKDYTFNSKNGSCPSCSAFGRKWFIQDKFFGGSYQYCLMSVSEEPRTKYVFKTKEEFAKWLQDDKSDDEYSEEVTDYIIRRNLVHDYYNMASLVKNDKCYVYDKENLTLTPFLERKQETGWCDSYFECLNMAKEILRKRGESA